MDAYNNRRVLQAVNPPPPSVRPPPKPTCLVYVDLPNICRRRPDATDDTKKAQINDIHAKNVWYLSAHRMRWDVFAQVIRELTGDDSAARNGFARAYAKVPGRAKHDYGYTVSTMQRAGFTAVHQAEKDIDHLIITDMMRDGMKSLVRHGELNLVIVSGDRDYLYPAIALAEEAKAIGAKLLFHVITWEHAKGRLHDKVPHLHLIEHHLERIDPIGHSNWLHDREEQRAKNAQRASFRHATALGALARR